MAAIVMLVASMGLLQEAVQHLPLDPVILAIGVAGMVVAVLRPAALRAAFNSSSARVAHQVAIDQASELTPVGPTRAQIFAVIAEAAAARSAGVVVCLRGSIRRVHVIAARAYAVVGAHDLTLHPRLAVSLVARYVA